VWLWLALVKFHPDKPFGLGVVDARRPKLTRRRNRTFWQTGPEAGFLQIDVYVNVN
jgi:hypothetical protein